MRKISNDISKLAEFSLDFKDARKITNIGSFKRVDNVMLRIKLMHGSQPLDLNGNRTIKVYANSPETNSPIYQETGINIISYNPAIVEIALKNCFTEEEGVLGAELEVINENGTLITSNSFCFSVGTKMNNLDSGHEVGQCVEFLKEISEFSAIAKPEEEKRKQAEVKRGRAEAERDIAEKKRVAAEEGRVSNETDRDNLFLSSQESRQTTFEASEVSRNEEEEKRKTTETARVAAETSRVSVETTRVNTENSRKTAETTRVNQENSRKTAEEGRVRVEASRVSAETSRATSETTRVNQETSRVSAETSRVNVERTRVTQEATRQTNETERQRAITAIQQKIDTVITNAEIDTIIANALK